MHNTKTISLTCAIAATLWALGTLLVLLETGLEMAVVTTDEARFWTGVGKLGLILCMGGMTLTVRGYAVWAVRHLTQRQAEWEQAAYDLGREVGRSETGVKRLR